MALPKAHHIETLSGFYSLKFSYDSTNTHYFTGGTSTVVEGTPDILYTDIAYIKPLSAIYTHAKIYPCPVLEYDDVPTDGSSNPVTSDGLYDELRIVNTPTLTVGNTTYPIVYLDADDFQYLEYDYGDTSYEMYVVPHLDTDKAYVIRNIERSEGLPKEIAFSNSGSFIVKIEDAGSLVGYMGIFNDTNDIHFWQVVEGWVSMNVSSNSFNVTNMSMGEENGNDTTIPYYGIESDNDITTIQNAVENIPSGSGSSGVVTLKEKVLELESNKQDTLTFDNTPTTGSTNPVTSDGIKSAIDVVSQSAAQGLKCVDLSTYQGTTSGEIVKHVGATTADYVNGYDYKHVQSSVSRVVNNVSVSYDNFVAEPSQQSVIAQFRTPFYFSGNYATDVYGNYPYYGVFSSSSQDDETRCYYVLLGVENPDEPPTVTVGDWVYVADPYPSLNATPEQVIAVNSEEFTTEGGHVYSFEEYDYFDYPYMIVNEDGIELIVLGNNMPANIICPKLHISEVLTMNDTHLDPEISITITTQTSSWQQWNAQPPAVYTAGTGLKLSNNQFSLNVPRVARTANSLPGTNTAIFEEYSSGDNYNLPSNALYHILTMEGNDTTAATQLALCVNNDAVYYRRMTSSIWQPWLCLVNPTIDATPTASSTNPVQSGGTKTYVDNAVATKSNVVIRQWVIQ